MASGPKRLLVGRRGLTSDDHNDEAIAAHESYDSREETAEHSSQVFLRLLMPRLGEELCTLLNSFSEALILNVMALEAGPLEGNLVKIK